MLFAISKVTEFSGTLSVGVCLKLTSKSAQCARKSSADHAQTIVTGEIALHTDRIREKIHLVGIS